jgi:polysaccharide pyruvyl transferase WcaK-like protein
MEGNRDIELGEALFSRGKIEESKNYFLTLLKKFPDNAQILNNVGVMFYEQGNIGEAEHYFLRALASQADYVESLLNLADLYQNQKRWKEAAEQLEKCVLIHADDPELFNQLAMVYLEAGNFVQARNEIRKSLKLNPAQKDIQDIFTTLEEKICLGSESDSASYLNVSSQRDRLNILIRGGGFVNKGAEAMVRTVQREIARRLPHARFFMEVPLQMEKFIESQGLSPVIANSRGRYMELDGVIDVSGFALGDDWGINNAQYYHYHNSIFESFGKPIVFLPQAWGPFTNKSMRQLCAAAINLSDYTYARDKRSYKYISELEGVNRQNIGLAPDIAYQFEGASTSQAMKVLKQNGIVPEPRQMVGIMPNMQVYLRTEGTGPENKYVQLLIGIAKYFLNEKKFSVVLIPHQVQPVENPDAPDDRFLCDLIKTALGNEHNVVVLRDYYSSEILKAVIGQMDLVIGSRYHGIIAAISQMIPTVVLGWSHKYFELLSDVGIEQYIADYKNLNTDDIFALVENAWIRRREISSTLAQKVPEQVHLSAGVLDQAAAIFKDGVQ